VAVAITIRGLRGGHSGLDIQRNRGNAIRLLSRALLRLQRDGVAWRLVDFHGGSKRNAIPREAVAELRVRAEMVGRIPGLLQHYLGELKALHADAEADWELVFNLLEDRGKAPVIAEDAGHFISFLYTAPHGVLTLSAAIPGLVESSCNLGVVRCDPERFEVVLCVRSSNPAALAMIPDQIAAQGHGLGLVVRTQAGYPSWQPDMSSALLAIAARAYEEFAGSPPQITAIHAGLECGLLKELLPDCDMISFGPDIRNAHSPDEEVSIRSVGHVFGQVEVLLGHLCGPDQEAR
jgi:dipeptidase D